MNKIVLHLAAVPAVAAVGVSAGYLVGLTPMIHAVPLAIGYINLVVFSFCILCAWKKIPLGLERIPEGVFLQLSIFVSALILGTGLLGANWDETPYWWARQGGFLPATDAKHYFTQAVRWPDEYFDPLNSRRPLNTTFNILLFQVAGSSLLGVLAIKVALAAIGVGVFICGVSRHVDRLVALSSGLVLIYWIWPFTSVFLTEINSIMFASVGIGMVLIGGSIKNRATVLLGLVALTIASNLRPINPLLPAGVAFVVIWYLSKNNWRGILLGLATAIVLMFGSWVTSKGTLSIYGAPGSVLLGNIGHTLLGLSRGTGWYEAEQFYKSQHGNNSEEKANRLMMQMAVEQIKKNPETAITKMLQNFQYFSSEIYSEFTNSIGLGYPTMRICKTRFIHGRWIFLIFFTALFVFCFLTYRKYSLEVILFAGSLISVAGVAPLVYGDAGWRSLAGSFPALALFPVMFFGLVSGMRDRFRSSIPTPVEPSVVGPMVLVSRVLASGLLVILIISIFWPWVQSRIFGQSSPSVRVFRADLETGARQRWISGNSAIVNPATLLNELKIHEEILKEPLHLSHFFQQNQSSIQAIQLYISKDESTWEFICRDEILKEKLPPAALLHPLLPKFRIDHD
jgi:hypothetical protein